MFSSTQKSITHSGRISKVLVAILTGILLSPIGGVVSGNLLSSAVANTSRVTAITAADAYSAGQKVIAVSGDASRSPFLGQISGATGDRYDVANGQFTEQVTASDIRGKMVFVIPFIGTVFGWVGL